MIYCVETASQAGRMMRHEVVDAGVKVDGGGVVHSLLHHFRLAYGIVDRWQNSHASTFHLDRARSGFGHRFLGCLPHGFILRKRQSRQGG